jgi:chromosome segregation ATPase
MKKRIAKLKEEEVSLRDQIELNMKELDETVKDEIKSKSTDLKTTEDRLLSLIIEDQKLAENIRNKKLTISELNNTIADVQDKANEIKENLAQLKSSEDLKKELISEINDNLSEKEIKLAEVEDNLRIKNDVLSEKEIRLAGIEEELRTKYEVLQNSDLNYNELSQKMSDKLGEIQQIDQTLAIKSNQLTKISVGLSAIEDRASRFEVEARNFEMRRDDAHRQLISEREENKRLKEESRKLKELIPLLEQRSAEIKESNESLEIRFSEMLQKLNEEMNQINKKRSELGQALIKTEKDIREREQILTEKVSALDESERILNLRQGEIDSFEILLKNLKEQSELVKNDILTLDNKSTEKRNEISDLRLETELLQKKKIAVEQNLQEILFSMSNKVKRGSDNELKLNGEIKEYENRLMELNGSIKESMNELVELQSSLSNIKIEHEEHRSGITKLVSMKKKLLAEISKQQSFLQKYQKVNEKIKFEQAMILNRKHPESEEENLIDEPNINKINNAGEKFLKV